MKVYFHVRTHLKCAGLVTFILLQAVSYISAYFSKSESETSQALLQTCSEIRSMSLHARESMYRLASSYSSSKQVSFQEAVYCSLTELWLRKCFPRTVFVNTSIPSECIRICQSLERIEELNRDSTDVLKQNMVVRYIDRLNSQCQNEIYGIVDYICFTIFAAHYYLDYENKDKNYSQPDVLGEKTPEEISETLTKSLPLMSAFKKLKLRKTIAGFKASRAKQTSPPRNVCTLFVVYILPFSK